MMAPDNVPLSDAVALLGTPLSEEHHREIVEGSGVHPSRVEGRYFSVSAEEARALGFSKVQARAGWVVELISPTGEVFHQLKPDRPRVDKKADQLKPIKYETAAGHSPHIGAHRSDLTSLQDVSVGLWVIEGAKKADCAESRGRLTIALTGVWNWGKKRKKCGGVKYGRPELLPDWDFIPLEGRKVYIAFDADYREKRSVALAMKGLAERLTERGAHVYIISLPGPEKGLDDFVVAGGDLNDLERTARPYQACDFTPYVATEDRRVLEVVELVKERMKIDPTFRKGKVGKTDHSHMLAFLEMALERGRMNGEAVELIAPTREMQGRAAIGSRATLGESDARLQERGYITKIPGDHHRGRPNRYLINPPKVNHLIGKGGGQESIDPSNGSLSSDFVPHFRWPAPPPPKGEPDRGPMTSILPLGKTAEFAIYLLNLWGGRSTVRDLASSVGYSDPSKFRSHVLSVPAEFGVVDLSEKRKHSAVVSLAPDWRAKLDKIREEAGEFAQARNQAVRYRESREEYHSPSESDPTSDLPSREEVRRILQASAQSDEATRVEEQRVEVSVTAEVPAAVVPVHSEVNTLAEDWLSHPLDCECEYCLYPEPKYARPYRGSGVRYE